MEDLSLAEVVRQMETEAATRQWALATAGTEDSPSTDYDPDLEEDEGLPSRRLRRSA